MHANFYPFLSSECLLYIGLALCQELHKDTKINNAQALSSRNSSLTDKINIKAASIIMHTIVY